MGLDENGRFSCSLIFLPLGKRPECLLDQNSALDCLRIS